MTCVYDTKICDFSYQRALKSRITINPFIIEKLNSDLGSKELHNYWAAVVILPIYQGSGDTWDMFPLYQILFQLTLTQWK